MRGSQEFVSFLMGCPLLRVSLCQGPLYTLYVNRNLIIIPVLKAVDTLPISTIYLRETARDTSLIMFTSTKKCLCYIHMEYFY